MPEKKDSSYTPECDAYKVKVTELLKTVGEKKKAICEKADFKKNDVEKTAADSQECLCFQTTVYENEAPIEGEAPLTGKTACKCLQVIRSKKLMADEKACKSAAKDDEAKTTCSVAKK